MVHERLKVLQHLDQGAPDGAQQLRCRVQPAALPGAVPREALRKGDRRVEVPAADVRRRIHQHHLHCCTVLFELAARASARMPDCQLEPSRIFHLIATPDGGFRTEDSGCKAHQGDAIAKCRHCAAKTSLISPLLKSRTFCFSFGKIPLSLHEVQARQPLHLSPGCCRHRSGRWPCPRTPPAAPPSASGCTPRGAPWPGNRRPRSPPQHPPVCVHIMKHHQSPLHDRPCGVHARPTFQPHGSSSDDILLCIIARNNLLILDGLCARIHQLMPPLRWPQHACHGGNMDPDVILDCC